MGRGEGVKERRVQNRNVPLEIPAAVSSSRGASAIGRPNWIDHLSTMSFHGLF